ELQNKLDNLPENPGVYQFFNDKGKILYIGKAKNLKSRVKSYFLANRPSGRIAIMVQKIHDLQMIVTDSEIEALVLENNLIKENKPRYNVLLKDDKSFPYIKVTNEPFPRIYPTRRLVRDGSKYFGPYTDVKNMRASLRLINQIFKIRSCKLALTDENINAKKFKVCLDFHIKKCDGPCEGLQTKESYKVMVQEVTRFLSGKTSEIIKDLRVEMNEASADLRFEAAAAIRDKLQKLEALSEKQKVISTDFIDRDIVAIAVGEKEAACSIFNIRSGKLVGKKQIGVRAESGEELPELYSSVMKQYYSNEFVDVPEEIVVDTIPADDEVLAEWLSIRAGKKVSVALPYQNFQKQLTKMCLENAKLQLGEILLQKMKREGKVPHALVSLKRDLRLSKLPQVIECFDISNLQGSDTVASMVVFKDAKPAKSRYRKFIIEDVDGPDDFASMQQVIRRRYTRLINENQPLPDLIMVDGGKGQLSSAVEILRELKIKNFEIIGLAKRLEEVFLPGESDPYIIPKTSSALKLLQRVRDEAHRFAITFHRSRRQKRIITTELLDIKGIGKNTAGKLLKTFGSLKSLREAPVSELEACVGKAKAKVVIAFFESQQTMPEGNSVQKEDKNSGLEQ
ncbi:MAG: excinuclease ABC subunit C, partial [Ignavibacteriales bacterium]|nr:excinuclease ABC subunit C [Ignavibacteriales bacterium]